MMMRKVPYRDKPIPVSNPEPHRAKNLAQCLPREENAHIPLSYNCSGLNPLVV